MTRTRDAVAAMALIGVGTAVSAEEPTFGFSDTVEVGASTLGLFVAPSYRLGENFYLRTPLYFPVFSPEISYEGNTSTDSEARVYALHLMGDYYIGNSGFRVSGGLSLGGYSIDATFENPTIDGTTYNADITATVEQDYWITPVLSVGWNHMFNDKWGMNADVGMRIDSMNVTATGQEVLDPVARASFNEDLREANQEVNDSRIIPFISLGATIKF